jgi:uncharacterized protein YwqG
MGAIEEFRQLNTRRASILQVGGLRPTGDPFASNFGLLPLGLPSEPWPLMNEKPMMFVCQMNLAAAPEVPALLRDIKLITFFVKGSASALKKENGKGWCLRAYESLDGLAPIARPEKAPSVKRGFECRWEACDDYPNHDDPERIVPDGFDADEIELDNVARTKIGGYASSIQSEPWWGCKKHTADPAFCVQINSEEKVGLVWGDGGAIYLARGTAEGRQSDWFLDWQCY